MELQTLISHPVPAPESRTFGLSGALVVDGIERDRCSRRPRRQVLLDERRRSGRVPAMRGRGTYQSGLFAEEVVADLLAERGWKLIGHRVRTKVGEIDLVARRGSAVVFAEVKSARPSRIDVEHAVDGKARHRIRRAAVAWMACNPRLQIGVRTYRFDVFLVRCDDEGSVTRIDQVRDAF